MLYFRERGLDRIEVWRIADIVDVSEAELPHRCLTLLRCVSRELVHEEAYLVVTVLLT